MDLERLAPVRGVLGNMDGPDLARLVPEKLEFELEGSRIGLIRENVLPPLLYVEVMQIKPFPPFDRKAPWAKQMAPPVPLICLPPEDSEFI